MGNITKLALRNAMVRAARLVKESSGARTAREWRSGKGAQMLRLRFYVPQCCGKRDLGRRANDPGESELWRAHISLNPTPALYPVVRVACGRGNEDTPPFIRSTTAHAPEVALAKGRSRAWTAHPITFAISCLPLRTATAWNTYPCLFVWLLLARTVAGLSSKGGRQNRRDHHAPTELIFPDQRTRQPNRPEVRADLNL